MADKNNHEIISFLKQKDYELINDSLGRGSFGRTVLLKDPFIDELFVAKKYEPSDESINDEYYKNFLEEIKILHKLSHPNIVRVFNYYAYEKQHTGYILMEYINGSNIAEYFDNLPKLKEKKHAIDDIFEQIIEAFCCIESNNIIHRDIRENNILVTEDGIVKIIDFGIGKALNDSVNKSLSHDSLARNINRPSALPREYYDEKYTIKTDMFYIGELFNRLVYPLLQGESSLLFSYQDLVRKMMEVNPEERFDSFAKIKEQLSQDAFNRLNVTKKDREIYGSFANNFFSCIASFSESPLYNTESNFISKLEKVLQDNIFEDYVQNNASLVECLVRSKFSYYQGKEIVAVEDLSNFIKWYKRHNKEAQKIILSNIINKLNRIEISLDFADIPF